MFSLLLGPLHTFIIKTFVNDPTLQRQSNVAFTCGTIEADGHSLSVLFECVPHTIGRYLRILKLTTDDALSLCDVRINGMHTSYHSIVDTFNVFVSKIALDIFLRPTVTFCFHTILITLVADIAR